MSKKKAPVSRGLLTDRQGGQWAQTDRAMHEEWGRLSHQKPRAAALAHFLVAHMDAQTSAVVASWRTLAQLSGMSVATVRRAMADLEALNWVEGVQLGGGGAKAWVVNSRVAWARGRDKLRYARFSARVLAAENEQREPLEGREPLRRIPVLAPGEQQLPSGDGEDPPSQPYFDGLEPPLPHIERDEHGREWEVDPETGEIQGCITTGGGDE